MRTAFWCFCWCCDKPYKRDCRTCITFYNIVIIASRYDNEGCIIVYVNFCGNPSDTNSKALIFMKYISSRHCSGKKF